MDNMIFNPQEAYDSQLKALHAEKTEQFFQELVKRSGINIEENRKTVQQYEECLDAYAKLKRKRNLLRFFRVLMCISIILIPLVILKLTPKIRSLKEEMETLDTKADELMALANKQMFPLNHLFTDTDALRLTEAVLPLLSFDSGLSATQEADMRLNYDLIHEEDPEQSTVDLLAGRYNGNPFFFENRLVHTMGTETYHGYKTIHWTETYRDANGKTQTRTRSETLHATVTKPKPFYHTQVVLHYGAQAAPDLFFSRDASHLHEKSERSLERYVDRGEKRLQRLADDAVADNREFTAMANTDFEVVFDALNRDNEVQFRTLFTPLAQTNMLDLLLSKTGYGDDFAFIKRKRANEIVSNHSQNRAITLTPDVYSSYSYDIAHQNFTSKNAEFFKAVYFDFAPLLAIPAYQERPVHSLKPIPPLAQQYSLRECEALANAVPMEQVVHPDTKTQAILKSTYIRTQNKADETRVTAYSYDIAQQEDLVSVYGGDGHYHTVRVPWDEYLPLVNHSTFLVTDVAHAPANTGASAARNTLRIFRQ